MINFTSCQIFFHDCLARILSKKISNNELDILFIAIMIEINLNFKKSLLQNNGLNLN